MLEKAPMYAYVPEKDVAHARRFYEGTLGFGPPAGGKPRQRRCDKRRRVAYASMTIDSALRAAAPWCTTSTLLPSGSRT
jgi:hypothetical protein